MSNLGLNGRPCWNYTKTQLICAAVKDKRSTVSPTLKQIMQGMEIDFSVAKGYPAHGEYRQQRWH
jgi:hypothetical protein